MIYLSPKLIILRLVNNVEKFHIQNLINIKIPNFRYRSTFLHKDSDSCVYGCVSCANLIKSSIAEWYKNHQSLPKSHVDDLLKNLSTNFPSLPKTLHTILKPEKFSIEKMGGGEYVHFPNWLDNMHKYITSMCEQKNFSILV